MQHGEIEVLRFGRDFGEQIPVRRASINLLFATRAAGCASQVGYQNDLISRLDW